MRRGGGSAGSVQPAAMADGEWRLGYEGVARDPLEVGGGQQGLTWCCPRWCGSAGRSRRWGRGPVVTGGAGVVGDTLCIGADLVGAVVGPSVAEGGGARSGA
jgi:hypothetical protein